MDQARRRNAEPPSGVRLASRAPMVPGLQALIDEGGWDNRGDLADVYLDWGGYAYGSGQEGEGAGSDFAERLADDRSRRAHPGQPRARYSGFRRLLSVHGRPGGDRADPARSCAAHRAYRHLAAGGAAVAAARRRNLPRGARPRRQSEMDRRCDAARLQGRLRDCRHGRLSVRLCGQHQCGLAIIISISCSLPIWKTSACETSWQTANPAALRETAARFAEAIRRGLWTPRSNAPPI